MSELSDQLAVAKSDPNCVRSASNGGRQARNALVFLLFLIAGYAALLAIASVIVLQLANRIFDMDPMRVGEVYVAMRLHGLLAATAAFTGLALRRREAVHPRWARLMLSVGAVCIVVSCDRIAAVCYPPPSEVNSIFEPHPVRGWSHRLSAVGTGDGARTRTNHLGFRGPPLSPDKPADEFRILFLGDSITFGYVQDEESTLSEQARRLLQPKLAGRTIATLNAGVEGYATWQQLDLLADEGLRAQPDLVVVQHCLNDITDIVYLKPGQVSGEDRSFEFSNTSHWSGLLRAITTIRAKRYLRQVFEKTVWSGQSGNELGPDGSDPFGELFRRPLRPAVDEAWRRALADLDRMNDFCRQHYLPWVLVGFPFNFQVSADAPDTLPQDRLRAWAAERDVLFLDLLPTLHAAMVEQGRGVGQIMLDEVHLTPFGTGIAAKRIVEFLAEQFLLP